MLAVTYSAPKEQHQGPAGLLGGLIDCMLGCARTTLNLKPVALAPGEEVNAFYAEIPAPEAQTPLCSETSFSVVLCTGIDLRTGLASQRHQVP